jgi:hypothetical protein
VRVSSSDWLNLEISDWFEMSQSQNPAQVKFSDLSKDVQETMKKFAYSDNKLIQ